MEFGIESDTNLELFLNSGIATLLQEQRLQDLEWQHLRSKPERTSLGLNTASQYQLIEPKTTPPPQIVMKKASTTLYFHSDTEICGHTKGKI